MALLDQLPDHTSVESTRPPTTPRRPLELQWAANVRVTQKRNDVAQPPFPN